MTDFHLNKEDDETFELTCLTNMRDTPFVLDRSDDYMELYRRKWTCEEDPECSDNFEVYTVSVVKKYPHEMK